MKIVEMARNVKDILELFKETWLLWIGLGLGWFSMIYACLQVERGYILDILLMRVEKLSEVRRNAIEFQVANLEGLDYLSEYNIQVSRDNKKTLYMYVNESLGVIPKGKKYNIYYLKGCKAVVKVEVLEGAVEPEKEELILMDEPIIPQYSKEELKVMTKMHHWRPIGLLVYCLVIFFVLIIWGDIQKKTIFIGMCWKKDDVQ